MVPMCRRDRGYAPAFAGIYELTEPQRVLDSRLVLVSLLDSYMQYQSVKCRLQDTPQRTSAR